MPTNSVSLSKANAFVYIKTRLGSLTMNFVKEKMYLYASKKFIEPLFRECRRQFYQTILQNLNIDLLFF